MFTLTLFILAGVGLSIPALDYVLLKGRRRTAPYLTLATMAIALAVYAMMAAYLFSSSSIAMFDGALRLDFYGAFLGALVAAGALLVAVASFPEASKWPLSPSFYSLLLLALMGVEVMLYIADLVVLLVTWALVAVASYVLVGIRKDEASAEGAAKYALMGVASSSLMVYGIAVLYGLTGSTALPPKSPQQGFLLFSAGVMLLVASFGFKLGVVPFHGWLPDVYGGVHPLIVSYIAGVVKVVGIIALVRVLYPLAPALGIKWTQLLAVLSIATMTFGNIVALVQQNVQRMMAYSSIAHAGYLLVGLAAAVSPAGRPYGIQGVALHMAAYILAKVGIFLGLAYLARKGVELTLSGISGVGRTMPAISLGIAVQVISLMGIPPFLGFWSKFIYLFLSVFDIAPGLALVAIINSGISVGYYAQVLRQMYFPKEPPKEAREEAVTDPAVIAVLITAIATVALGLGPAVALAPRLIPAT